MDDDVKSLEDNHIWNFVDTPKKHKILRDKCVNKLKYKIDRTISRYEACWVAKGFEQRESIDFEESFSPVIKSCTTQILLALAAFYTCSVESMDSVIKYLNSEIDVILYIKHPLIIRLLAKYVFSERLSIPSSSGRNNCLKIRPRI